MIPYRSNIERVLGLATADEIADGLIAYRMQHGIARVIHRVYGTLSLSHAAGLIAALSPLNNWDDNVTDAFAMARWGRDGGDVPIVRTTGLHRERARRIAAGELPDVVLAGRKVTTFWKLTVDPERDDTGLAIDRHLAAIAAGRVMTEHETSRLLLREYSAIENAYLDVALQHGMRGWQAASVAWYAWRRMKTQRTIGQRLLEGAT